MPDFLRLWFVLAFAYALLKFAVNLGIAGAVDLRSIVAWELLLVPLGQALVVTAIRRGRSRS